MRDGGSRFAGSTRRADAGRFSPGGRRADLSAPVRAGGSGAPETTRRTTRAAALAIATVALFTLVASPAAQAKDILGWVGSGTGSGEVAGTFNNPRDVAVNTTGEGPANAGDFYIADDNNNRIQQFSADGNFIRTWGVDVVGVNEQQNVVIDATGGTYTLGFMGEVTEPINSFTGAFGVRSKLEALPSIGVGNLTSANIAGGVSITFVGPFAGEDVPELVPDSTNLTGRTATATVTTVADGKDVEFPSTDFEICEDPSLCSGGIATGGNPSDNLRNGALDNPQSIAVDGDTGNVYVSDRDNRRINEYDGGGNFIRSFGWDVDGTEPGAEYEICPAADRCKAGVGGSGTGQLGTTNSSGTFGLAISPPDGEPSTGTLYLANSGDKRIETFALDGTSPGSLAGAPEAEFGGVYPTKIAVDSRGIVYASNEKNEGEIERYDSEDFNGGGVGFLEPLIGRINERQEFRFEGMNTTTSFTMTCPNGETTEPIPYQFSNQTSRNIEHVMEDNCDAPGSFSITLNDTPRAIFYIGKYEGVDVPPSVCTIIGGPGTCYQTGERDGRPGALLKGNGSATVGLAVDLTTDALNVLRNPTAGFQEPNPGPARVQQIGPVNDPGLTVAPVHEDESHGNFRGTSTFSNPGVIGFGINPATGRLYVSSTGEFGNLPAAHRVDILDNPSPPPTATIDSITNVTSSSANVFATVNPNTSTTIPNPASASAQLQYKLSSESEWESFGGAKLIGMGQIGVPISRILSQLTPNQTYDVRFLVTTPYGLSVPGEEESFTTAGAPPPIDAVSSANVTASSIDLFATINPLGEDTTYRFEYGPTPEYGSAAPFPDGELTPVFSGQKVSVHLVDLKAVPYHFRVVAENGSGRSVSEDQTFSFYPEPCPNNAVRQQTGSGHLADCRAYELVSPSEAGTLNLFSAGAPTSRASNPPRVMYAGNFGTLEGVNAANYLFDPYVATRTPTGWQTHYTGIDASIAGGPGGQPGLFNISPASDESLDTIIQWRFAPPGLFAHDFWYQGTRHYSPYVFGPNGESRGRLPTNLGEVPGADNGIALDFGFEPIDSPDNGWKGDQELSENGQHYFFSTNDYQFAPGGLVEPDAGPGSVYDNDLKTGEVTIASKLPGTQGGGNIPAESTQPNHFIEVFDSSRDGSHLLIGAPSACNGGNAYFLCSKLFRYAKAHLYMRVDGAITYDVSQGNRVDYQGMTADGSTLYFTSPEPLTADDTDESIDLYMWREQTEEITRVSASPEGGGIGNSDECEVIWIEKCGVEVVPAVGVGLEEEAGSFNSAPSDNSIASDSGDIYFYSPEQLVASNATPDGRNLYVRRPNGDIQYVTSFESENSKRIKRIQVTPDGTYAALLTASPLTTYDNGEQAMVYRYDAETGNIVCGSCLPNGDPPPTRQFPGREKILVSQSGLFMSDDGRFFWSTPDALVPRDTNEEDDIYGYSGGRAQLITTGTGPRVARYEFNSLGNFFGKTGTLGVRLIGVSADGIDVYFQTNETLVPQDHNGEFQKIYDARTNGGFPISAEVAPCKAADECHAPTTPAPLAPNITSTAGLGGGNVARHKHRSKRHRKHRRRRSKRRHQGRRAHRRGAGHAARGSRRHRRAGK